MKATVSGREYLKRIASHIESGEHKLSAASIDFPLSNVGVLTCEFIVTEELMKELAGLSVDSNSIKGL